MMGTEIFLKKGEIVMEKDVTLSALVPGQRGRVKSLSVAGAQRRRLQDIGLIPGTVVQCVYRGSAGGLLACSVRGAVIALRKKDAERILLTADDRGTEA